MTRGQPAGRSGSGASTFRTAAFAIDILRFYSYAPRVAASRIPALSRTARGVRLMKLDPGDEVQGAKVVPASMAEAAA